MTQLIFPNGNYMTFNTTISLECFLKGFKYYGSHNVGGAMVYESPKFEHKLHEHHDPDKTSMYYATPTCINPVGPGKTLTSCYNIMDKDVCNYSYNYDDSFACGWGPTGCTDRGKQCVPPHPSLLKDIPQPLKDWPTCASVGRTNPVENCKDPTDAPTCEKSYDKDDGGEGRHTICDWAIIEPDPFPTCSIIGQQMCIV